MQAVERQGRIEVSANLVEQAILIKVTDNGPGIPQEKLASIF
jgi:signal transduction histidine kinase